MRLVAGLLVVGLAQASDSPEAIEPSESQVEMHRALSVRHPEPACADIEALSSDPVNDLLFLVEHAEQPPWAGMRAAQCLADGHAQDVKGKLETWVVDERYKGLGLLVLGRLEVMPREVALEVGRKALAGPLEDDARKWILRSEDAEIRALVEEP